MFLAMIDGRSGHEVRTDGRCHAVGSRAGRNGRSRQEAKDAMGSVNDEALKAVGSRKKNSGGSSSLPLACVVAAPPRQQPTPRLRSSHAVANCRPRWVRPGRRENGLLRTRAAGHGSGRAACQDLYDDAGRAAARMAQWSARAGTDGLRDPGRRQSLAHTGGGRACGPGAVQVPPARTAARSGAWLDGRSRAVNRDARDEHRVVLRHRPVGLDGAGGRGRYVRRARDRCRRPLRGTPRAASVGSHPIRSTERAPPAMS